MWLWWIGNAVLLVAVVPVVLLLANRVMRPALEIKRYADDILEHCRRADREPRALAGGGRHPGSGLRGQGPGRALRRSGGTAAVTGGNL